MYYKCFEFSSCHFFLVAEEERWFMREKWPTYKQQRREGDHIIIFKINSKIFTNTKFNIAYVAAKKYPSMWRRSCDDFCKQTTFFCIPIFLLGKIGCSKVSVPNDSQKNMQTFYAFSLLSVFQKKIFSVSIDSPFWSHWFSLPSWLTANISGFRIMKLIILKSLKFPTCLKFWRY